MTAEQTPTEPSEPEGRGSNPEPDTATDPSPQEPADPDDEPLGEGGVRALNRERERRKQAEQELRQLRDQLAARERTEVARAKGLPEALAARLQGDSREEWEADADRIAAEMTPPTVVPSSRFQGETHTPAPEPSVSAIADKIHSQQW